MGGLEGGRQYFITLQARFSTSSKIEEKVLGFDERPPWVTFIKIQFFRHTSYCRSFYCNSKVRLAVAMKGCGR